MAAFLASTLFWLTVILGWIGYMLAFVIAAGVAQKFVCDLVAYEWSWDSKSGAFVVRVGSVRGRREMLSLRTEETTKSGQTEVQEVWDLILDQLFPSNFANSSKKERAQRNLSLSLGRVLDTVYYHIARPDLLPEATNYDIVMSEHFVECRDGVIVRLRRVVKGGLTPKPSNSPSPSAIIFAPAWASDTDSLTPFANHMLFTNPTVTEVWLLDHRGGAWWCQTHPARAGGLGWCYSHVGLFDWPAAIDYVRKFGSVGDNIHCVGHCMGAVSLQVAAAHGMLENVRTATSLNAGLVNELSSLQRSFILLWDVLERFLPSWGQSVGSPGAAPLTKLVHRLSMLWHSRISGCPSNALLSLSLGRIGVEGPFLSRNLPADRHWRVGHAFGGEFGMRVAVSAGELQNPGAGGANRFCIAQEAAALRTYHNAQGSSFPIEGARAHDALGKLQRQSKLPSMAFMAGNRNAMMGTSSLHVGLSLLLTQQNPPKIETRVLTDVGHFDCLWGNTAPQVTFDPIAQFIQDSTKQVSTKQVSQGNASQQKSTEDPVVAMIVASQSCEIGLAIAKELGAPLILTVSDLVNTHEDDLVAQFDGISTVLYVAPIGDLGSGPCLGEEAKDDQNEAYQCDQWRKQTGYRLRDAPLNSQPRVQRAVHAFNTMASVCQRVSSIGRLVLASSVLTVCPTDALSRKTPSKESEVYTELDGCSWNKDGGGAGAAVAVEVALAKTRGALHSSGVKTEVICFGEPWGQARPDSTVLMDPFERAKNFRLAAAEGKRIKNVVWAVTLAHEIAETLASRAVSKTDGAFRTVAVSAVVRSEHLYSYAECDTQLSRLFRKSKSQGSTLSLFGTGKEQGAIFSLKRGAYFASAGSAVRFENEQSRSLVKPVEGHAILEMCSQLFFANLLERKRSTSFASGGDDKSDGFVDVQAPASPVTVNQDEVAKDLFAEPLATTFRKAAGHVANRGSSWKLKQSDKLAFYGLYKYANEGPSVGGPPPRFQAAARAKFKAWASLGAKMTRDEAMKKYIQKVESFSPGWNTGSNDLVLRP